MRLEELHLAVLTVFNLWTSLVQCQGSPSASKVTESADSWIQRRRIAPIQRRSVAPVFFARQLSVVVQSAWLRAVWSISGFGKPCGSGVCCHHCLLCQRRRCSDSHRRGCSYVHTLGMWRRVEAVKADRAVRTQTALHRRTCNKLPIVSTSVSTGSRQLTS